MNEQMKATDFLAKLGYTGAALKSGPTAIVRALQTEGIRPVDCKTQGRGVAFMVDAREAEAIIKKKTAPPPPPAPVQRENAPPSGRHRRDLRTVARALLHLYNLLGEEPHQSSGLREIAERERG